jgi:hypothetical protein
MIINEKVSPKTLSLQHIFRTWWPLATSWLLMGAESPALSAIVARLEDPEINLAAYGGIVLPIAMIIEAPILMLLSASTALSRDWQSYKKIWRFMMIVGGILTLLHAFIAFTPLYYLIAEKIIGAPQEIIQPARMGMIIMTPWTWAIAYRRFHQGVLIRFGHSKAVGFGTAIRLMADLFVLILGYRIGSVPGVVVATSAVTIGVLCEAFYVGLVVKPILNDLKAIPISKEPLSLRNFLEFYIPLAMTSFLFLLVQPIGSAAISRMPNALSSLAVWPVVTGLVFMIRSLGIAYNEVVIALLDLPKSYFNLRAFMHILFISTIILLVLITATPLSDLWFSKIQGINLELTKLAKSAMWLAVPMPGLNVLQSWYQGSILYGRKTRVVTESVALFLTTACAILILGIIWGKLPGLYVGLFAFSLSMCIQTAWLWYRSLPVISYIKSRDKVDVLPIREIIAK